MVTSKQIFPCLLLIDLFSHSNFVSAATYYTAKSGKNSNPCTQASPCLTISTALAKAIVPGDMVVVKAGTYSETVAQWNSGSPGRPITVKANPGDDVVWRSSSVDPISEAGALVISNCSYIRIEGFHFDGTVNRATIRVRGPFDAKDNSPNVAGIEIVNNIFTNNGNDGTAVGGAISKMIYLMGIGYGSTYSGSAVNRIVGNRFEGNYGVDVWLLQSSDTQIADNVSVNVKSSLLSDGSFCARSIHLGGGSKRNVVERNIISSMVRQLYISASYTAEGLKLDAGSTDNIYQDNIVHDLDFAGTQSARGIFSESGCSRNLFQRNIIYNIGGQGLREGSLLTNAVVGSSWINNTVYNCKNAGLVLTNSKGTVVKNNLFVNNGLSQVYVSSKSVAYGGLSFRNNDYFKAGKAEIGNWNGSSAVSPPADKTLAQWAQVSGETNSLSVDPQFVSPPADLHLLATSPVRTAGEGGFSMGAYQEPNGVSLISIPTGLRVLP